MIRIMWYPKGKKELIEEFLYKLLELEREDKITLWSDEDENGKRFYDIREVQNENTSSKPISTRHKQRDCSTY